MASPDKPQWIARRYRYANGITARNRYGIYFYDAQREDYCSVGGVLVFSTGRAVASPGAQWIEKDYALKGVGGTYIWGGTLRECLAAFKQRYPNPLDHPDC